MTNASAVPSKVIVSTKKRRDDAAASKAAMRILMQNSTKARAFPFVASTSIAVAAIGLLLIASWFSRHVSADNKVTGEAVYREYCASCHDHPGPSIPPRSSLQSLSAARILRTLDAGVMMRIAYGLQRNQREAVANYLGKASDDIEPPAQTASSRCPKIHTRVGLDGVRLYQTTGFNPRGPLHSLLNKFAI